MFEQLLRYAQIGADHVGCEMIGRGMIATACALKDPDEVGLNHLAIIDDPAYESAHPDAAQTSNGRGWGEGV